MTNTTLATFSSVACRVIVRAVVSVMLLVKVAVLLAVEKVLNISAGQVSGATGSHVMGKVEPSLFRVNVSVAPCATVT